MSAAVSHRDRLVRWLVGVFLMVAGGAGGLLVAPENAADGLAYDLLIWARASLTPAAPIPPAESPVAVISVDARSLDAPEIAHIPRVLMGPVWAEVIGGVLAGGARSVTFDIIFAYSANKFLPDYDLTLMKSLGQNRGKVVLARSLWTFPSRPLLMANGGERNPYSTGLVELLPDGDGVFRRVPHTVYDGHRDLPGLAFSGFSAGGYKDFPPTGVLVAPRARLEKQVPTYALIDILRCARANPEGLRPYIGDKLLYVGTTLPEEDRKESADRFLPRPRETIPEHDPANPCVIHPMSYSAPESVTNPGVFIHAAAVQQVLRGDNMIPVAQAVSAGLMALLALAGFLLAMLLGAGPAMAASAAVIIAVVGASYGLLLNNIWLPPVTLLGAFLFSLLGTYLLRYVQEEKRRQSIQSAFGNYLPRSIVEKLSEGTADLSLGGEMREVTIMFADLSGFTALSTLLGPEELMQTTNTYLAIIAQAVEESGGYVDKFIGDAVMAIWNAPLAMPRHPVAALRGAMAARDGVLGRKAADEAQGIPGFAIKVGLNAGHAIVGNVGTARRMNYTVVGEAVNIAARLESVPKDYGGSLVIGESVAEAVQEDIYCLELDRIRVVGRPAPLAVFLPLVPLPEVQPEHTHAVTRFDAALSSYRKQAFTAAARLWLALAEDVHKTLAEKPVPALADIAAAARKMAARAEDFAAEPPPAEWDGVFTRAGK